MHKIQLNMFFPLCNHRNFFLFLPIGNIKSTATQSIFQPLYYSVIYSQHPLNCTALAGDYHNDIIHMQSGLDNPSNSETKP